ncbi:hypothetical protein B0T25DRAFT_564148 [Lasiosphaeria hispida]|uniref:Uncharacterized protein n=1 Tax=Lasiosphaeria hispida TaxID=260671 RepID=A0AAJ0HQ02_9PEZI|nr:hypothetical protein B0T25DRAFT_564148 [Lasiosphaeria hispida]
MHQHLTDDLLQLGTTSSYRDSSGGNALLIAATCGDVPLLGKLCSASSSGLVASEAIPLVFDVLKQGNQGDLLEALSLLISHGATGAHVEQTVLKAVEYTAFRKIIRTLLPTGISLAALGPVTRAVIKRRGNWGILALLCRRTMVLKEVLETALEDVLYLRQYEETKALILSGIALKHQYNDVLDRLLAPPARDNHPRGQEIADMLLAHGTSINAGHGRVLAAAAAADQEKFAKLVKMGPNPEALESALEAAMDLRPASARTNVVRHGESRINNTTEIDSVGILEHQAAAASAV